MKRLLLPLLVPVLIAAAVAGFALTSDTSYSTGSEPEYLALGDSLGYGYGASDPATKGYVPLFRDYLESEDAWDTDLLLNNLSIPGATSSSLISDQLSTAVAELVARNGDADNSNDVEVVTIDIGGNDLLAILWSGTCSGGVTPDCAALISTTFATFSANFDYTLGELRTAAGPSTPIIAMTYYNSLVGAGCPYSSMEPLGDLILEGDPAQGLAVGFNDLIRSIAAAHNVKVADLVPGGVFPALLGPSDILPDCVHANDSGYQIIADEFADVFGIRAVGGIVELRLDSSSSDLSLHQSDTSSFSYYYIALAAGGVSVGAIVLAAGAWYARRRWPGRSV
jgi:lysophospholipase L1-like esterase